MMFGAGGNPDQPECVRMIHRTLDAGINFIDTADAYRKGESEEIVGQALEGRRDSVIVGTKVYHPMGTDPNQQGSSRRWITRAVEDSLRRLRTDYIDLYQLHRPTPDTDIEESLSVLTDLMHAGKVRLIGTSTFPAADVLDAQWVSERRGLARFRAEQQPYSILNRAIERDMLSTCQRFQHGVDEQGQSHEPGEQSEQMPSPPLIAEPSPVGGRRIATPSHHDGVDWLIQKSSE